MKTLRLLGLLLVTTGCSSTEQMVPNPGSCDWVQHIPREATLQNAFRLTYATPTTNFHMFGDFVDTNTTRAISLDLQNGNDIEIFVLNGGEAYELNIYRLGKGFTYSFDSNGVMIGSGQTEKGYK